MCVAKRSFESEGSAVFRGTVKAAVLVGDPDCPNLVASSVYDTKPINYLSMVSEKIEWVVKSKPVFNVETNETEDLRFLRLNQIHKYNKEMGGVDIADQLRGVYRIDRFVRNRKWWFSLLFWGIGVLLTNAYKLYISVCADEAVVPFYKEQYQFRTAIAEYWINPDVITKELQEGTRKRKFDNESVGSLSCMSPITNPLSFCSPSNSTTVGSKKNGQRRTINGRNHLQTIH